MAVEITEEKGGFFNSELGQNVKGLFDFALDGYTKYKSVEQAEKALDIQEKQAETNVTVEALSKATSETSKASLNIAKVGLWVGGISLVALLGLAIFTATKNK